MAGRRDTCRHPPQVVTQAVTQHQRQVAPAGAPQRQNLSFKRFLALTGAPMAA